MRTDGGFGEAYEPENAEERDEDDRTKEFCEGCDDEVPADEIEDGLCGDCRYHFQEGEKWSDYRASVL